MTQATSPMKLTAALGSFSHVALRDDHEAI